MPGHFDPWTVLLSFGIACLAGFVAFEAVGHTYYSSRPRFWVSAGGITLGLGIWSMHFVGMIAWHPPFALYYSLSRTLLSVLVAIAASWLAMYLAARNLSRGSLWMKAAGALLVGAGICSMHYIGMAALHFTGAAMWHWPWVAASFAIAAAASWVAMELLDRSRGDIFSLRRQVLASAVIGAAICGMHYAGMAALMLPAGVESVRLPWSFSGELLARVGVGNALLITVGLLVVSYRDKAVWVRMVTEARLETQQTARRLEGMAAAGKIAASVAHEINNPLEAVTNLLYLVGLGEVGEQERKLVDMAQAELRRIAEITAHTLRFYRQTSGPGVTSIPELFDSALALFQKPLQRSGITVEKRWPAEVPPVVCQEGEIRQVLTNLVSNAMDAMANGGRLRLTIEPVAKGLKIEIADTGNGIPEELRDKVLQPFFTTKGFEGTGLGLSISTEIVARHGGRLTFTTSTDPGHSGTAFSIFLPYAFSGGEAAQVR